MGRHILAYCELCMRMHYCLGTCKHKLWKTDIEEQSRDGSKTANVNHAQVVRQVALSRAHEEQSGEWYAHMTYQTQWQNIW